MGLRGPKARSKEEQKRRGDRRISRRADKKKESPPDRVVNPFKITDSELDAAIIKLPGYDPHRDSKGFYFDHDRARWYCRTFAERLTHQRGEDSQSAFTLSESELAIVCNLFGWRSEKTKGPRYRECFLTEARGEGKTTFAAGCVLAVMLDPTLPGGSEIYSAAYAREQANLVFSQCWGMVNSDASLHEELEPLTFAIVKREDPLTSYKSIPAEASTAHGFNSRFVVVDELHTQKNRRLIDALRTAMGKRKDMQIIYITTAGDTPLPTNICYEIYDHARKVRDGITKDATFLPAIYEVPPDADWELEANWSLAHPNRYDYQLDTLRVEYARAKANPAYENTFRQLHLNQWVSTSSRWISLATWQRCREAFDLEAMKGWTAYGGLDLSHTRDLSAFALCFPPQKTPSGLICDVYRLVVWHFMPDADLRHREEIDRAEYRQWANEGRLSLTRKPSTDFGQIRERILWANKEFRLKEVAYDPWNASHLTSQLTDEDRITMEPHRQGFASMSPPAKQFERLVLDGAIIYDNPMLDWQIDNLAIDTDPSGNIKPNKADSTSRIDGIVAGIMSVGRAMLATKKPSVYNSRGFIEATW